MPTALVTGAAKRIGKAVALRLAEEGYDVIVHYNTSEKEAKDVCKEIEKTGVKAFPVQADLTDLAQIDKLISNSVNKFKKIDVLVNNASTFNPDKLLTLTDRTLFEKRFSESIDSNLKGPLYLATKLGKIMKNQQKEGFIINMGDSAQTSGRPYKGYLFYHVSKSGLIGATQTLAVELAPEVRVNMIANGPIEPPENFSEKSIKNIASTTALKKWGGADSVSEAVIYFIRNKNATGDILTNDGGKHLL